MDISAQQAKIDQLTAAVAQDQVSITTAQSQLDQDQKDLATAQEDIKFGLLVNQIEALSADEVTALASALAADGVANTLGVTVTVANPPSGASQA